MPKSKIVFVLLLFSLGVLISCSKNSTEPENENITNINGNWTGTTSQGYEVFFTIVSSSVTVFSIKVRTVGFTSTMRTEAIAGYSITAVSPKNTFSLQMGKFPDTCYIGASFTSNTTCEGTYSYRGESGSWSANKE